MSNNVVLHHTKNELITINPQTTFNHGFVQLQLIKSLNRNNNNNYQITSDTTEHYNQQYKCHVQQSKT